MTTTTHFLKMANFASIYRQGNLYSASKKCYKTDNGTRIPDIHLPHKSSQKMINEKYAVTSTHFCNKIGQAKQIVSVKQAKLAISHFHHSPTMLPSCFTCSYGPCAYLSANELPLFNKYTHHTLCLCLL